MKEKLESNVSTLEYIETMLAQLRSMSQQQEEHFLSYLIEMAMHEAGTIRKIAKGEVIAFPGNTTPEDLADAYFNGTLD